MRGHRLKLVFPQFTCRGQCRDRICQFPLARRFDTVMGHEPPFEVAIQFESPRSRPPPLNGRSLASKLPVAPPQPGHERPSSDALVGHSHDCATPQAVIRSAGPPRILCRLRERLLCLWKRAFTSCPEVPQPKRRRYSSRMSPSRKHTTTPHAPSHARANALQNG